MQIPDSRLARWNFCLTRVSNNFFSFNQVSLLKPTQVLSNKKTTVKKSSFNSFSPQKLLTTSRYFRLQNWIILNKTFLLKLHNCVFTTINLRWQQSKKGFFNFLLPFRSSIDFCHNRFSIHLQNGQVGKLFVLCLLELYEKSFKYYFSHFNLQLKVIKIFHSKFFSIKVIQVAKEKSQNQYISIVKQKALSNKKSDMIFMKLVSLRWRIKKSQGKHLKVNKDIDRVSSESTCCLIFYGFSLSREL